MRDTPGEMASTIICPDCKSENIESVPGAGGIATPAYRCLDCGSEFDAGGGEPLLADSDDAHAP